MDPLISIIVPVYNVEQYLDKCVESIVNQTYPNLEIILVDDGSSDSCPALCDKWERSDSRVIVIHKDNGGVSSARNAALEVSSGDYLGFVDSDDYIEPDMYENLIDSIKQNKSDVAVCGFKYKDNCFSFKNNAVISSSEAKIMMFNNRDFPSFEGYSCNKLYSARIIQGNKIRFNEKYLICEDTLFNFSVFDYSDKISLVNCCGYNYQYRSSSASNNFDEKLNLGILEITEYFLNNSDSVLKDEVMSWSIKFWIGKADNLIKSDDKSKFKKVIRPLLKKRINDIIHCPKISIINKIESIIIVFVPDIFFIYYKIKARNYMSL